MSAILPLAFANCQSILSIIGGAFMNTSIDKFGRVLIPKALRDQLGLEPDATLEIEQQGSALILKVRVDSPRFKREGGVLVLVGKRTGNIENVLHEIREERLNNLGEM